MAAAEARSGRRRAASAGRSARRACAGLLAALGASITGLALADGAPLARVGGIAIEAAEFRQRAARVNPLQWQRLGAAWPEQRRRFLAEVLIAEALLSLAAERGPAALPLARDRALARALSAEIAREATQALPSDAQVRAYRELHARELGTPRSIGIWRILLATEAEAQTAIAELTPPTPDAFSRIARERSLDRATNMRGGNLGLVAADGQTAVPELRVAPALFAAADRVGDGQLVPEPVREGDAFAVVWRRTSRAATSLPAGEIAALVAARLAEQRAAAAQTALIERLRREQLGAYSPQRAIDHEPRFPELRPSLPRGAALAEPTRLPRLVPETTDRGLR